MVVYAIILVMAWLSFFRETVIGYRLVDVLIMYACVYKLMRGFYEKM